MRHTSVPVDAVVPLANVQFAAQFIIAAIIMCVVFGLVASYIDTKPPRNKNRKRPF